MKSLKALLLVCAAIVAGVTTADAQRAGEMAVGIDMFGGISVKDGVPSHFGLGAKYQYSCTDRIRLEGDIDYSFRNDNISMVEIMANVHYLVPAASDFYIYPIVGLGWARPKAHGADGWSKSYNYFAFNVGMGGEYKFDSTWSMALELKYEYIKHFGRIPISLGVQYHF